MTCGARWTRDDSNPVGGSGAHAEPQQQSACRAARAAHQVQQSSADALDPSPAPGIVDDPAAGGMTLGDQDAVIGGITERCRRRAVALTALNPTRDVGGVTLRSALRVIVHVSGAGGRS